MFDIPRRMRRHALAAATAVALSSIVAGSAFSAGSGPSVQSAAADSKFRLAAQPIEGQYIVVLKDEMASLAGEPASRRPAVADVARALTFQHRAELTMSFQHVLRGFVVRASDKALAGLIADERVAYVEEDGVAHASATQSNATWGLDRTDQRNLPLSTTYTYDTTASSVHAYIIDTGIRASHTDFGGRVSGGYTAIKDGKGTSDCNGHGTHVAGTVGGKTWGIAKAVKLHPVRVLGCDGTGPNSGVVAGMDWVVANQVKPAVANMSLGDSATQSIDDAAARMTKAGVTLVVAAGNDNASACGYSPARAPSAITVGATTSSDSRWSSSNHGTCLDIFAPGESVKSAWSTNDTATNSISGTSMASPHVAGVAALYLAVNPGATPSQVTTALINNATPGKVTGGQAGSPNRLLYSLPGGPSGPKTYKRTKDVPIPDAGKAVTSRVTVAGRTGNAGNAVPVTINIVHPNIGDLVIDLVAPDGTAYNLHNKTGGSADNIKKTVNLNLSSEALNGAWRLRAQDGAAGNTGKINSWSITF